MLMGSDYRRLLAALFKNYIMGKNNGVKYIVYNINTLIIKETFDWMGRDILTLLRSDNELKLLNNTHPKSKAILSQINLINGTTY